MEKPRLWIPILILTLFNIASLAWFIPILGSGREGQYTPIWFLIFLVVGFGWKFFTKISFMKVLEIFGLSMLFSFLGGLALIFIFMGLSGV